eukprot:3312983-Rhodomonas_salina.1
MPGRGGGHAMNKYRTLHSRCVADTPRLYRILNSSRVANNLQQYRTLQSSPVADTRTSHNSASHDAVHEHQP